MMNSALPALGLLLLLAACGGEPDMPTAPMAEEERVLSEAAEMLPAATPTPTSTMAPTMAPTLAPTPGTAASDAAD